MLSNKQQANDEKMRELILLISQESEGDAPFGAIKLNKLLFYADFIAYRQLGQPITGHEYMRLPNGPAPRKLVPIREQMEAAGELAISTRQYLGRTQHRTVALREPSLSGFTAEEISLVHKLIKQCWGKSARELSELSHRFAGWKLADERETIPYNVALVVRGNRSRAAEATAARYGDKARAFHNRVQDAG